MEKKAFLFLKSLFFDVDTEIADGQLAAGRVPVNAAEKVNLTKNLTCLVGGYRRGII